MPVHLRSSRADVDGGAHSLALAMAAPTPAPHMKRDKDKAV
jgi:hypothetical protein